MSTASANSKVAKTSKKEVKEESKENIRVVGGPLNILEKEKGKYEIVIDPEHIVDFSTPMMDLAKSVGTFTKVVDENGKIVKRIDKKNGIEYIFDKESLAKAINKTKTVKTDKTDR